MTRDDILRMAREVWSAGELYIGPPESILERFAALVAAAEREACAEICEAEAEKWEGDDGPICHEARLCAVNIRARGQHE